MKITVEDVAKKQDLTLGTYVKADNNYMNLTKLKREIAEEKGQHKFTSFLLQFDLISYEKSSKDAQKTKIIMDGK